MHDVSPVFPAVGPACAILWHCIVVAHYVYLSHLSVHGWALSYTPPRLIDRGRCPCCCRYEQGRLEQAGDREDLSDMVAEHQVYICADGGRMSRSTRAACVRAQACTCTCTGHCVCLCLLLLACSRNIFALPRYRCVSTWCHAPRLHCSTRAPRFPLFHTPPCLPQSLVLAVPLVASMLAVSAYCILLRYHSASFFGKMLPACEPLARRAERSCERLTPETACDCTTPTPWVCCSRLGSQHSPTVL